MIKKRKNAVKKISAGDRVKFPTDRKPAEEGEKIGKDWIFSNFPRGIKISLSPPSVRMINNPGKNFRSLAKEGDFTKKMSNETRDKPTRI